MHTVNPDNKSYDFVIIGGGPAGIQASRILRGHHTSPSVAVIRPEDHSMIYCAIPYAIEGIIPFEKTLKKDNIVTDTGATLIRSKAEHIDPKSQTVKLTNGDTISYSRLLIATGADPIRPDMPGMHAHNVFTIKTEQDARNIIQKSAQSGCTPHDLGNNAPSKPQRAVVIGSGAIGIEQASALHANGLDVHLVEMRDHLLPHLLDCDMAELALKELKNKGVNVHLNNKLEQLQGDEYVNAAILSDGTKIELNSGQDFMIVAVGMKPNIGFLKNIEFAKDYDGLVVDEHMKTNIPHVWAAGDCCSFYSGIDKRPLGGKLATNAVPMAKIAAKNMLGDKDACYQGFFNGAATVVGNYRFGGTGFTEEFARSRGFDVMTSSANTTARFPMMPDAGYVKVKLIIDKQTHRILGAQVVATEAATERIDLLTYAIQRKATVEQLSELSYSAQPWQSFFPAKNVIVEAATKVIDK